jgi:hypothetical protein
LRTGACDAGMVGGAADARAAAALDTGAVAPRRAALGVRIARRDVAATGLFTEFQATVAFRSMISFRIAFWFDASLPQSGPSGFVVYRSDYYRTDRG